MSGDRARRITISLAAALLVAGCSSVHEHPIVARSSSPQNLTSSPSQSSPSQPTRTPIASPAAMGGWRFGPRTAHVNLVMVTGAPDGLYGVEPVGYRPPFRFRLVRVDPATLHVQRSSLISGEPSGLTVDTGGTVYVGVPGSRAVLRFASRTLTPLRSWRDPVAALRGPLAVTRSGLWVADNHGLTRLLGDGVEAGTSAQRWPYTVLLQSAWDEPNLLGNSFWVTALDRHGCPALYSGSGPNGLEGQPLPVLSAECELGFGRLATGPAGTVASVPTGMLAGTALLRLDVNTGRWTSRSGPNGSNGIEPSVAGNRLFVSDVDWLDCIDGTGRELAKLALTESQALPQIVEAGGRDFIVFTEGNIGAANGPRVQTFTAPSACRP